MKSFCLSCVITIVDSIYVICRRFICLVFMLLCVLAVPLLGSWCALLMICPMTLQFSSAFILRTICVFVLFPVIAFLLSLSVQTNFTSVVRIFMREYTCVVNSSTGEIVASFLHHFDAQSFMKSHSRYSLECDLLILPLLSTHVDIDDPFGESRKVQDVD